MCAGRLQRIGRDVVVGVAEIVRHVEDEVGEEDQEDDHREGVLDRAYGVKGTVSALDFTSMPVGLLLPGDVQRPDVQDHDAGDHERQQVVQREEAVQRRVVDREAAPAATA